MAAVQAITQLLGVLAWPAVVLIGVALLRHELRALVGRLREIEGPGDFKFTLDPNKVEQIIKEGGAPSAIAGRIIQSVMDKREARILRALVDDAGRTIYNYQTDYYRPALELLLAKGYVTKVGKGFALTDQGLRITKEYLLGVLEGPEKSQLE